MQKRVWVFQYRRDIDRKGANKASWYVGYVDHEGKRRGESCGPGSRGRKKAEQHKRLLQSELDTRIHRPDGRVRWELFRREYEEKVLAALEPSTQQQVRTALNHFKRIVRPGRMESIRTQMVDDFVSRRRKERGKKRGSVVSPATINKDLRHLKAVFHVAVDWGYLLKAPKCRMQREPEKLPRYVTPEHFAMLYHKA